MRIASVLLLITQCFLASFSIAETSRSTPLAQLVIYPARSAPATASSLNTTTLSSQLLATVKQINTHISQNVKRGDILLTLDCTNYQLNHQMSKANAAEASARLKLYQSQLTRAEKIYSKALISKEDVDIRSTEVVAQQALVQQRKVAVKLAQLDISRCDIKAPFNGIVTQRLAGVGQLTNVGDALLTIIDTENLELSANVNYEDAQQFQNVDAFVFDFGTQVAVSIINMGGIINSQTRNQEIRFSFTTTKPLPGTAGKLLWTDPQPYIPINLIVKRNGQFGIFIDNNGIAKFTPLNQASPGRPAPTLLSLDTLVVTQKVALLQDGELLKAN